jgi:hypothetical protein
MLSFRIIFVLEVPLSQLLIHNNKEASGILAGFQFEK